MTVAQYFTYLHTGLAEKKTKQKQEQNKNESIKVIDSLDRTVVLSHESVLL